MTAVSKRSVPYDRSLIPRLLIENNIFGKAYSESILVLADALYDSIQKQYRVLLHNIDKDQLIRPIALKILSSSDCELLVAIMEGNLSLKARLDPRMRQIMLSHNGSKKGRAGIYVQYIVSGITHRGLTPRELHHVVSCIRKYFVDDKYALEIDQTVTSTRGRKSWIKTERRNHPKARRYAGYYAKDLFHQHRYTVLSRRQKRTLELATNIETAINLIPKDKWDIPMEKPLTEVGWTKDADVWLKSHANHNDSNHLMCLIHAIAIKEFPFAEVSSGSARGLLYSGPEQAALAEAIFTHLAHPWVADATGFTHHPPGLNNDSVMNITTRQWIDALTVHKYSPFATNIRGMMEPYERTKAETRRLQDETIRI